MRSSILPRIDFISLIEFSIRNSLYQLIPNIFKNIFSTKAPSFLCLPDLVSGMPIFLEIRALKAEIPTNLLQEKPPLFMMILFYELIPTSRAFATI